MPFAAPSACREQPCPHPAVDRGRCSIHARTTTGRGYGFAHQAERAAALPGAKCEGCGCSRNLQRDHRDPTLTGPAREAPANKRWLCRCPEHGCHDRLGVRSDRPRGSAAADPAARRDASPYRGPIRA